MHSLVWLNNLLTHPVHMALQGQEDVSCLVQVIQDTWQKETTLVGMGSNGLHSSRPDLVRTLEDHVGTLRRPES